MSGWTDVWHLIEEIGSAGQDVGTGGLAVEGQVGEQGTAGNAVISGAESGAGAFGAITGFLVAVTDWHLWASVGWLLLGILLVVMGFRLWLGKQPLPAPPVPIPV